VFEKERKSAGT